MKSIPLKLVVYLYTLHAVDKSILWQHLQAAIEKNTPDNRNSTLFHVENIVSEGISDRVYNSVVSSVCESFRRNIRLS